MKYPKISIITPTSNSARQLKACILSVAHQSYANKEHVIVDNLSTDGTLAILKRYSTLYPHIRFISENDKGIYELKRQYIKLEKKEG